MNRKDLETSFTVTVWRVPAHMHQEGQPQWQADCGAHHARGYSPGDAMQHLYLYLRKVLPK